MIEQLFFYRPEVMTLIWVAIFVSDWLMNYNGAKIYYSQAREFFVFEEGDSLKPISEDEIAHPRTLVSRFLSELVIGSLGMWFLLYNCRLYSSNVFYGVVCGFFILMQACIHFRHLGNIALFSSTRRGYGIRGSISIPRWILLRTAAFDYAIFAAAFLIVYIVNRNHFVLGGVVSCFSLAAFMLVYSAVERYEFFSAHPEAVGT